jgi:choline dehydrogenase-like flavoprotein
MLWWELEQWPTEVRWYLENAGYQKAEELMYWPAKPFQYQDDIKFFLKSFLPDYNHFDAPMAVRNQNQTFISTGLFSTADLLTESKMTDGTAGNNKLSINLNHAVVKIETAGDKVTGVVAYDLLAKRYRTFKARHVVLSAGTIESAKLAKMSTLKDPNGLIGKGITDHPIFFTHFSIPQGKPKHSKEFSSKILSQHKQSSAIAHPYNMLIELGADLNQGRYLDIDILKQHQIQKANSMLCEIVFLFNSPLVAENKVIHNGQSFTKPFIDMKDSNSADNFWGEVNNLKNQVIAQLEGEALQGDDLTLKRAALGGVAHEVGTLRLGAGNTGVVDESLKFNGYDNLFVCDLSVFPVSAAANPTLTLAALSIRLSEHIKTLL